MSPLGFLPPKFFFLSLGASPCFKTDGGAISFSSAVTPHLSVADDFGTFYFFPLFRSLKSLSRFFF